ncbi:MAG: hypothetical protein ASARMPREDX12_005634 [Alectoria sarmentosa]|nr:MAG: hypothetical protein ASARMPRED_008639 [Alectoria sarmentosa]CAD6573019.1 MAG: hypothetical protein ASARMPREDX12_005634 [Alectoria sarmentosa]
MPPRLRICPQCHHLLKHQPTSYQYLSTASAITPAAPPSQLTSSPPPIARFPRTQPPSHKPPEFRKSQLHRQYTSLLRSTPLLLLFQHNNLRATEWMSIRRELHFALEKVDSDLSTNLAPAIKIQAIQVGIFESALLVAEYYHPEQHRAASKIPHPTDPSTQSSAQLANHIPSPADPTLTHYLSRTAHSAAAPHKKTNPLRPLLSGPLAAVSFPTVTPQHMRAALGILAPKAPTFPAPTRRANPGYHDASVQQGLQKLMLLGARVEGRVFDNEGARWVGGIAGGMEGLRGQLVRILGEVGAGVTGALEGAGRSLWVTVEGRRGMLEDEENGRSSRDS